MSRRPGLLVDRDLHAAMRCGDLVVTDLDPQMIRPAAVSLRLGDEGSCFGPKARWTSPTRFLPELAPRPTDEQGRIVLRPGEVMLTRTMERVGVGDRLAGLLDGTSDWARLGVSVVLAHQVSPGYGYARWLDR